MKILSLLPYAAALVITGCGPQYSQAPRENPLSYEAAPGAIATPKVNKSYFAPCDVKDKGKAKCIQQGPYSYRIAECDSFGWFVSEGDTRTVIGMFINPTACKDVCAEYKGPDCLTPVTAGDSTPAPIEITIDPETGTGTLNFEVVVPPKGSPVGPAEIRVIPTPTKN